MAPERKYPYMSKEEMISFIQKLAAELGRSPSQADMRKVRGAVAQDLQPVWRDEAGGEGGRAGAWSERRGAE